MAAINVTTVSVLDNPSLFTNPLQFEIQYECLYDLKDDLEWKLIYVGSAETEKYDQVLDSVLVGPVAPGSYRFVFQADPPDPSKLPQDDIIGVTVLLLTCSYRGKEFMRVGYYVNNEYWEEELRETPPERVLIDRLCRNILADKPRVTKFPVEFDAPPEAMPAMTVDMHQQGGLVQDGGQPEDALQMQHAALQQAAMRQAELEQATAMQEAYAPEASMPLGGLHPEHSVQSMES